MRSKEVKGFRYDAICNLKRSKVIGMMSLLLTSCVSVSCDDRTKESNVVFFRESLSPILAVAEGGGIPGWDSGE